MSTTKPDTETGWSKMNSLSHAINEMNALPDINGADSARLQQFVEVTTREVKAVGGASAGTTLEMIGYIRELEHRLYNGAGAEWSDEFPEVEETFYWIRHKENHADLNVGLLRDRTLLLAEGGSMSKSPRRDFEFLPASPSDFEQLIRLRKASNDALRFMEWNADPTANNYPDNLPMGYDVIAALREALAHTGEQS